MSRLTIDTGTEGNAATGDSLRAAFTKVNTNFAELYTELGTDGTLSDLKFTNNIISSEQTNQNIILSPNGTGLIDVDTRRIINVSNPTSAQDAATKAYVDAQNVAQTITFVGDDSTGTAVNSGETIKIAGGTGLTSVISGDTITLDIDSTVATLTGSQELTNKTITFGSNTISGTAAQFNTGVVDADFATLDGSEVLTNKTISTASNTITGTVITIVGDDSTGTAVNIGETFKIAGAGLVTTAVSGDTLTITGSKDINVNSITSGDSSAIQINDAINVSGQGTFNSTTKFNAGVTIGANVEPDGTFVRQLGAGDKRWVQIYTLNLDMMGSLTVDGTAGQAGQLLQSNGGSYVPAWTSNITVNSIASSDSSAIQINDAVNVSGAGTFHGSVRFNAGYTENINALTSSSTITVNCATASIHTVTLAASTGFVITGLPTGGSVTLIITQGGSGSYTATFGTDGSTTVKFPGGAPTLSTAVGAIDVVTIFNDGTNYLGNIAKAYA